MRGLIALIAMLALAGCSMATKPVDLAKARQGQVEIVPTGKPIVITEITDARDFSRLPDDDGPRVDPDYLKQLGETGRVKVISGAPHGPLMWVAAHDRSVMDEMRTLLAGSLMQRGYRVVDAAEAPADAPRIKVTITEFWCYVPMNFGRALTWTLQMKAWVAADIVIATERESRTIAVKGYAAHITQAGGERNIAQAFDMAMTDFDRDLGAKLFTSM